MRHPDEEFERVELYVGLLDVRELFRFRDAARHDDQLKRFKQIGFAFRPDHVLVLFREQGEVLIEYFVEVE